MIWIVYFYLMDLKHTKTIVPSLFYILEKKDSDLDAYIRKCMDGY